jgi:enediyne biosynthesis protein E4
MTHTRHPSPRPSPRARGEGLRKKAAGLRPRGVSLALAVALFGAMITLGAQAPAAKKPQAAPAAAAVAFTDVTKAAGITFKHNNGAFGKHYLPETMGSGVVFVDFDGDGYPDLFFVNSKNWPDHPGAKSYPALYHNNKNGTFTDITKQAGLQLELYGFGATAADYDNDGHVDLFVTALAGNHLFHNNGNGTFTDVTAKAGVGAAAFSTSAAWFDYDKDGFVDLVVLNYVQWSADKDLFCTLDGKTKSYCTPESYKGESPILYHNKHDGTFEDVTKAAGLYDPTSKALGVALIDYNGDGWLDLFVANDTQPNRLYRNTGKGSFVDEAVASGVAFNEAGVARAGMGVDAADYDRSGRESLIIGNFSNEMMALYHNEGTNLFIDEAPTATIGQASLLSLTFGCFFFDYDLDGLLDVFAANGHVADDINRVQPKVTYAQAPHLFHNLGNKHFEVASGAIGLPERLVARGTAYADFDNDGDLDIVVATNNGAAHLLRNDGGNRNNALRVALIGTKSNRSGIGARIIASLEGGGTVRAMVKSGSSYMSQSDLPVTFGLGRATKVAGLEVQWPSGQVEKIPATDGNQTIVVEEGKGIVKRTPFQKAGPAS